MFLNSQDTNGHLIVSRMQYFSGERIPYCNQLINFEILVEILKFFYPENLVLKFFYLENLVTKYDFKRSLRQLYHRTKNLDVTF